MFIVYQHEWELRELQRQKQAAQDAQSFKLKTKNLVLDVEGKEEERLDNEELSQMFPDYAYDYADLQQENEIAPLYTPEQHSSVQDDDLAGVVSGYHFAFFVPEADQFITRCSLLEVVLRSYSTALSLISGMYLL